MESKTDKMEETTYKEWTRVWSKTHNAYYWYSALSKKSVWEHPSTLDENKAKEETSERSSKRARIEEKLETSPDVYVAIIVPFRDIHKEQHRSAHLNRFIEYMPKFLRANGCDTSSNHQHHKRFKIFIIEQSTDDRKFNRGKLLNIGFKIALEEGYNVFIFHDVDLLPSDDLFSTYWTIPQDKHPLHIAQLWNRYNNNPKYFGGIVSFSSHMFESINGFPNNFWGWGGEDDEMYKRLQEVGYEPIAPHQGTIVDMEDMTLATKLTVLREHRVWKCMNKNEVLDEHESTWKTNGLSTLKYDIIINRIDMNPDTVKITVDVQLNDHWTDSRSGIDDSQLGS